MAANAQTSNATIFGKVTDENGLPVDMVNVSLKNYPFGTTTNRKGEYLFRIPSGREVAVVFSMIGYKMEERKLSLASEATFELNVVMSSSNQEIDEIVIQEQRQTSGNIVRINPKSISSLPDVGMGSVEGVLRTLPGVSSSNELSNQYSVRGGNFDENLVYVNGIEVYRPYPDPCRTARGFKLRQFRYGFIHSIFSRRLRCFLWRQNVIGFGH